MKKVLDLSGEMHGPMLVLNERRQKKTKGGYPIWEWLTECQRCGRRRWIRRSALRDGRRISCECISQPNKDICHHRLFTRWKGMMARCYKENSSGYESYGKRGIKVCSEWHDPRIFCEYWEKIIPEGSGLTIDRLNVNGDYSPENTRAATIEQQANNKRNNKKVGGRTIKEVAVETGLKYDTIRGRLRRGWSLEKMFLPSVDQKRRVVQKDKDGKVVKVWESISKIEKEKGFLGSNVCACCRGKLKTAYGFLWEYEKK